MNSQPDHLNHNQRVISELINSVDTSQNQSIQTTSDVDNEHPQTNSKFPLVSQLLNFLHLTLTPQPPALPTVIILILVIVILPRLTPSDTIFELNLKISPSYNQQEKATTPK